MYYKIRYRMFRVVSDEPSIIGLCQARLGHPNYVGTQWDVALPSVIDGYAIKPTVVCQPWPSLSHYAGLTVFNNVCYPCVLQIRYFVY